ncbi:MAG: FAD-dependent oxidoreductase, partial [Gammaproteobacteria bacterium]|nr:FAD-dependent oxidoreductase [Gammaproteobacteria bacterium]NIR95326.1 FAD-dependent oxidoreductase [Gammaproteobacteria bacterium]NIW45525.1 FAD-dependent oxidoreductase [Gammaproteobacteria bacterium]NIW98068.1 FAD-dependent oxidoreductase [Phycisphaerae bacterium]
YQENGIEIRAGELVSAIAKTDTGYHITLKTGNETETEATVAGLGILPNTELAEAADLEIKDGIVVNEYLHTSDPDIYAAGDVANFYNPALAKRIRVEHEDN